MKANSQDQRVRAVLSVLFSAFPLDEFPKGHGFEHEQAALLLCRREKEAELAFGQSQDIEVINLMRRQAEALLASIQGLRPFLRDALTISFSKELAAAIRNGDPHPSPMRETEASLKRLLVLLPEMQREPTFKKTASRKLNWRAASVVGTCRKVWGLALWHKSPENLHTNLEDSLNFERYRSFVQSAAPHFEKEPAGPFGRFTEAIFEALEITDIRGLPMPAATALRSWRNARSGVQKKQN